MLKVLCHNIYVVIQEMFELGIEPKLFLLKRLEEKKCMSFASKPHAGLFYALFFPILSLEPISQKHLKIRVVRN